MSHEARDALIRALADGRPHPAAELAGIAGLPADGVAAAVGALRAFGIAPGPAGVDGWALSAPLDLLDPETIRAGLSAPASGAVCSLEVATVLDSTSDSLASLSAAEPGRARVCLAEHQTRGRGRHSRRWIASFGAGICLSMDWVFPIRPSRIACLGLAVGVAAVDALTGLGVRGLSLKWPNDILVAGGKLGGVLIDAQGTADGPCRVVVGMGLNYRLSPADRSAIAAIGGQPADLAQACPGDPPSRNAVAIASIDALVRLLQGFADDNVADWIARWRAVDGLKGRRADVLLAGESFSGIAAGIDDEGALLLRAGSGVRRIVAGEVTLTRADHVAD